jgi:transposase InsO family protein
MLDTRTRELIALKRFSLLGPVLNGQVKNLKEYFGQLCAGPIEMPHYGSRVYSPKTLMSWLGDYRRGGFDSLKPGSRSDRGKSRKVNAEVMAKIKAKRAAHPRMTGVMLYEELVKEGVIAPEKLSLATFYRFLANNPELAAGKEPEEQELKRFSHQWVNELWQTDIMYGPYLQVGKTKRQTYLLAFIDDASRLITSAQFFFTQNFAALREAFKEAVLRRGIPKMIYTDNGKVYRCGQFAVVCANLGCSLLHTEPFAPHEKGKIERFFKTVRLRFLSALVPEKIKTLEELNLRFWQWLDEDYQRKMHRALNMSPLDYFMSQAHRLNVLTDPALLEEYFLLRVNRKVNHDGTFSLEKILYEAPPQLASSRVEVRYESEWLANPARPVFLYQDGIKVGKARQVNFHDNAHVKRKGRGRPAKDPEERAPAPGAPVASISFTSLLAEEGED